MARNVVKHPNETYMRLAIAKAKRSYKHGQYAIGAVVVLNGEVLSVANTTLDKTRNPLNHAEVNAIRAAVEKIKQRNPKATWYNVLEGAWLYSTFACCSMCTSLAIWSNMKGIVYGNTAQEFFDARGMTKKKSHYIYIETEKVVAEGNPKLTVYGGFLKDECSKLLELRR